MGYWKALIILKEIRLAANFCAFGLKTNEDLNSLRKILNLHMKIAMDNWLFTNFLSHLPRPLSFSTALKNNTIFLQEFFFRLGGASPLPLRAPLLPLGNQSARCSRSFPWTTNIEFQAVTHIQKPLPETVLVEVKVNQSPEIQQAVSPDVAEISLKWECFDILQWTNCEILHINNLLDSWGDSHDFWEFIKIRKAIKNFIKFC